jgi:hypothetical protein
VRRGLIILSPLSSESQSVNSPHHVGDIGYGISLTVALSQRLLSLSMEGGSLRFLTTATQIRYNFSSCRIENNVQANIIPQPEPSQISCNKDARFAFTSIIKPLKKLENE